jgi:hypothetical protein
MSWKHMLVTLSVALNVGLVVFLVMGGPETQDFPFPAACAQNRSITAGGFSATTAEVSSSRQALYIVDNREKRMNVYVVTSTKERMRPLATVDLKGPNAFGGDLAGEVVLIPGRISSTTEAVYAIDTAGRRMIIFYSNGKRLEVLTAVDLGRDFQQLP